MPSDFFENTTDGRIKDTKNFSTVQVPLSYLKAGIGSPREDDSKLQKLIRDSEGQVRLLDTSHDGMILGQIASDKKDQDCFYIYPLPAAVKKGISEARRIWYHDVNAVYSPGISTYVKPKAN